MSTFNVNTSKILEQSHDIGSIARRISRIEHEIAAVKNSGVLNDSGNAAVKASINRILDGVLDEAAKMNSFSNALGAIAQHYRKAEKEISGKQVSLQDIIKDIIAGISPVSEYDKRNLWRRIKDWLGNKTPDAYATTTPEQEKAADARMKKELWNILQDEKYSQEHWDNASIEERKQILQDYMNEVIKVYGLKDVDAKIHWDPNAKYTDKQILWGYYNHYSHTVTLNLNALTDKNSNWDSYELLETVSHELRHAYQHEAIDHPTDFMVTKDTINTWKENFDNYINFDDDKDGYYAQPVEVDARDFQVKRDFPPSFGDILKGGINISGGN